MLFLSVRRPIHTAAREQLHNKQRQGRMRVGWIAIAIAIARRWVTIELRTDRTVSCECIMIGWW